jgi:protein-disulfide isomerase
MKSRLFTLLSLAALLFVPGCKQKEDKGAKDEVANETGEVVAAGDETDCELLASKLCAKVNEKSPRCDAIRKTTDLLAPKACAAGLADIDYSLAKLDEASKACEELVGKLCADLGEDTQTCQMVKGQTPNMPPEQCDQMLGEYDKVLDELTRMEAKNKPLPPEKVAKMTEGNAPAFGPEDAKVTIVEFSDFQCPYCSRAANAVTQIKEKYGDQTRTVFRQFPLSFHKEAHLAAQASLAAHEQGKFWEYHDKLFENQKALGREDLEKYAKELGLDMAKFKKALDDGTHKATVDAELQLGKEVFVDGTPTMFINGTRVGNSTDFAAISAAIDKALAG